jgi:hypothetical protein
MPGLEFMCMVSYCSQGEAWQIRQKCRHPQPKFIPVEPIQGRKHDPW